MATGNGPDYRQDVGAEQVSSGGDRDDHNLRRGGDSRSDRESGGLVVRPTKRFRATKAQLQARYDAVLAIAREHQPTGLRFIYYTATTKKIVPKNDSGYGMVQRAVLHLRRSGRMPWEWIVDTNRWMRKPTTYGSVEDALYDLSASYRRALWHDSKTVVEVWCESESVAGVLYPITAKWDVPLYPIKGQTSDSFAYGAAQNYKADPRQLVVFYVGDHDPHGYEIETNLRAKLIEHSGRRDIEWERMACTAEDVERLELPGTKAKKTTYVDAICKTAVPWIGPAVEIEAIPPTTLRTWLDNWICDYVDPRKLEALELVEAEERNGLEAMARGWSA